MNRIICCLFLWIIALLTPMITWLAMLHVYGEYSTTVVIITNHSIREGSDGFQGWIVICDSQEI